MRPYSSVKAMRMFSCICFSVFGELEEVGPKDHKSWGGIYKEWSSVFNSIYHESNEALLKCKDHPRVKLYLF